MLTILEGEKPYLNTDQPIFYMMVGVPGSGKSTLAEEIIYSYGHISDHPPVLLSTDNYIEQKAAENDLTYNEAFPDYIKEATKDMNQKFDEALSSDHDIMLDQTNVSVETRRKKLVRVPAHYYKVAIYVIAPPEDIHRERLAGRKKFIRWSIVESMTLQLEPPTYEEGFDSVLYQTTVDT